MLSRTGAGLVLAARGSSSSGFTPTVAHRPSPSNVPATVAAANGLPRGQLPTSLVRPLLVLPLHFFLFPQFYATAPPVLENAINWMQVPLLAHIPLSIPPSAFLPIILIPILPCSEQQLNPHNASSIYIIRLYILGVSPPPTSHPRVIL